MLSVLADYVEWRRSNPADDLMTELLNAEVDEPDGSRRPLTRDEVVTYASMVAGAGNETATRLIGFTMQLLAQHPDQRRLLVEDPSLVPNAIEEILRLESPSPVQARYVQHDVEVHGTTVPEGSIMLLLNGAANRDERHWTEPRSARRPPRRGRPPVLRLRAALLSRRGLGAARRVASRSRRSCAAGPSGTSTSTEGRWPTPAACAGGATSPSDSPFASDH